MAMYTVHVFDDLAAERLTQDVECASDGEAINKLLDLAGDKSAELWCGDTKVLWWPGRVQRPGGGARRTPRQPWTSYQQMLSIS
jgi:hypothetical protein